MSNNISFSVQIVADILNVSKKNIEARVKKGELKIEKNNKILLSQLKQYPIFEFLNQRQKPKKIIPKSKYSAVEFFAGCGGLALGMEFAGIKCEMLTDIGRDMCDTLVSNRPNWNVIHEDIKKIDKKSLKKFEGVDLVTGGFPCQAFSYAGKKLGIEDTRGTLFYDFARSIKIIRPKIIVAENVRGLFTHDNGNTIKTIIKVFESIGYNIHNPRVLRAIFYNVPQKRERIFIIGIRKDLNLNFDYPTIVTFPPTVRDALKKGKIFNTNVPKSIGQQYSKYKAKIMSMVPEGGYWKDLPLKYQKDYMGNSFYLGGGKTGLARRLSWDEPSLTLTTAPAMNQTERAHPKENRPLTIREYARIQTFPDEWVFKGSSNSQYLQIGNAVPVNLSYHFGRSLVLCLNKERDIYSNDLGMLVNKENNELNLL